MRKRLTARKVETAKPGKYSDGGNLYLIVSDTGTRKWVLRFTWRGRPKEMGLGSASTVPLAQAREKAASARQAMARPQPHRGTQTRQRRAYVRGNGRRSAPVSLRGLSLRPAVTSNAPKTNHTTPALKPIIRLSRSRERAALPGLQDRAPWRS